MSPLPTGYLDGRFQDAGVAAAGAQVARQGLPDFRLARLRIAQPESGQGDCHSRGTETAAKNPAGENPAHLGKALELLNPFNGDDLGVRQHEGGHQAGVYGLAVHENQAGTALSVAATFTRTLQVEIVAQDIEQTGCRGTLHNRRLLVQDKA
jgi:hypothetical protein